MTTLRLPLPSNFSLDAVVRSHGWYDLPPFEYDRGRAILRTFVAHREQAAEVTFRERNGLEARAPALGRETLLRISRRVFSLNITFDGFDRLLEQEPRLAGALARGGGRMLRGATLFEDVVKMLLTTNCSWAATKGMVSRLVLLAGAGGRAFPTPEAVAALSLRFLKSKLRCGYRAFPLSRLARRVASGRLDLTRWERRDLTAQEIRAAILAEKGFGPYAAEGLLRILGRHDFLALDSWTRQKYRRLYPGPTRATDQSIARRYARFGEHRGLALWLDMTRDWHEGTEKVWP